MEILLPPQDVGPDPDCSKDLVHNGLPAREDRRDPSSLSQGVRGAGQDPHEAAARDELTEAGQRDARHKGNDQSTGGRRAGRYGTGVLGTDNVEDDPRPAHQLPVVHDIPGQTRLGQLFLRPLRSSVADQQLGARKARVYETAGHGPAQMAGAEDPKRSAGQQVQGPRKGRHERLMVDS